MKRVVVLVSVLAAVATAAPVVAQTPHPHGTPTSGANYSKVHTSTLTNPGSQHNTAGTLSGAACQTGAMANRAQTTVNPINGKQQAAPIVVIPLGKGNGSVASATTHAQQVQACSHASH
jgi:hypothetical protein